ncbi:MAG: HNH endonuclease [Nocardioidaceae bacterium]
MRHTDHVTAAADGGSTSLDNGQGLCEACNYTKRAPGWTSQTADHHTIHVTTPTGHRYASHPPPLPGTPTRASPIASTLEARLEALLDAA